MTTGWYRIPGKKVVFHFNGKISMPVGLRKSSIRVGYEPIWCVQDSLLRYNRKLDRMMRRAVLIREGGLYGIPYDIAKMVFGKSADRIVDFWIRKPVQGFLF